jgi:hypothetical protein
MNNSLKEMSTDIIRQNWLSYKDEIYNFPYLIELLWNDLETKFNIDKNNIYYSLFKKFICNEEIDYNKFSLENHIIIEKLNNETLILKGLDGEERKNIHILCDKIGLHHESKTHPKKKNKRFLYIYKPKIWLWEYTEKNPYSKSEEYYEKRELERLVKKQKLEEKLSRRYCCICDITGLETQLFCSVYIRGLYCGDCLETMSDGDGGLLGDHKFEPLY